ncbi:MAG: hypothetical protein AB8B87_26730 [Granulosicoccus sp.]
MPSESIGGFLEGMTVLTSSEDPVQEVGLC